MTSLPPPSILGLRLSVLLLAVAAATAALAPRAAPAQPPAAALVTGPGGTPERVVELAGREDVIARDYVVRGADGGTATRNVTGVSLAALLEAGGVDAFTLGYLELPRPSGGTLLLSRAQVLDEAAPPVAWAAPDGIHVLRASTGGGDANGADELVFAGGELPLHARDGRLLDVSISASDRRIEPGGSVTFSAELERAAAGEALDFAWLFDDGSDGAGATVTHRFARRGTYDVALGVTSAGDAVGASAIVTIQVGEPERDEDAPERRGAGTDTRADAPDSGAADAAPVPATPAGGPAVSAEPATRARPRRSSKRPEPAATPAPPAGPTVEGELVSAPAGATEINPPAAARTGRPPAEDGGGIPPLAGQLLVLAALLATGWTLESRRAR